MRFFSYKVYKLFPKSKLHNKYLTSLKSNDEYDFWSEINKVKKPVTLMVSPKVQNNFELNLTKLELKYELLINNLQR